LYNSNCKIKTWRRFAAQVRSKGCGLLGCLDQFPDSILVTGCQRSGTTILSRIITQSDGMTDYWEGKDDELDAALILSGQKQSPGKGRYCFQTTYLNECYREYFEHNGGYRVIWVLRNPFSVVYSMLYHWGRFAFNELFQVCGAELLDDAMAKRYSRIGRFAVPRILRACLAFNGKVSQLFELKKHLPDNAMIVIEYDDLVQDTEHVLPRIYSFIELPYKLQYGQKIHKKSTRKKKRLSQKEDDFVQQFCMPVYERAKKLLG
jgi:hypothetical protein